MKNTFLNIALSILSLSFTVLVLEIGLRVYCGEYRFHNFPEYELGLFKSAYPAEFDKELGWVPRKGNHPGNIWNTTVTILNDGIRSNGDTEDIGNEEIILAVGDSFTFGDQVSDDETWPAGLEKLADTRVINGGVFGYGIDQAYLRMLSLASKYRPDIVIFSFIPNDIRRVELSVRTSATKPYFELSENGVLILMNEHISPPVPHGPPAMSRKIAGYSLLAHEVMSRSFPEYWLHGRRIKTKVHSNGIEVTCRIFERLKRYALSENVPIYILVQQKENWFKKDTGPVDAVIACIDQDVLEIIDLRRSFSELRESDASRYDRLFDGHMTKEGNDFVASVLWETLSKRNGMSD